MDRDPGHGDVTQGGIVWVKGDLRRTEEGYLGRPGGDLRRRRGFWDDPSVRV